jgi:exonuclease III
MSLSELPYCDGYVDNNCFLGKGFKIGHINIRSIRNKIDHLKVFLHLNDFDILCVTETHLNDNDNNINIEGFNPIRLDRKLTEDIKGGGGILCYVKDGIMCKELPDLNDDAVESLCIEINLPHTKPFLLCTIYRPPKANADYLSKIDDLFQKWTSLYNDVVILGDFNLDQCKRPNLSKVNKMCKQSNLSQLIKDYTRITEDTRTIIDFIFVTNSNIVSNSGVHSLGLSDHSLIYLVRKHMKVKSNSRTIKSRSFKNFNENDYIDTIKSINCVTVRLSQLALFCLVNS